MSEPKWLLQSVIEVVHDMQIAEHGGLPGIRDGGLLQSALTRPQNLYEYEQADLFRLAASYAFAFVRYHPFADGNKRTAFLSAYIFLEINDVIFTTKEPETTAMVISLAADEITEEQFAKWLKQHSITEFD